MGAAGKALRQVLDTYGITQKKLAAALGVKPFVVFRWYHEQTDPSAQTILDIAEALEEIDPAAGKEFFRIYAGKFVEGQNQT
jgi:predicted transcriptional regulator